MHQQQQHQQQQQQLIQLQHQQHQQHQQQQQQQRQQQLIQPQQQQQYGSSNLSTSNLEPYANSFVPGSRNSAGIGFSPSSSSSASMSSATGMNRSASAWVPDLAGGRAASSSYGADAGAYGEEVASEPMVAVNYNGLSYFVPESQALAYAAQEAAAAAELQMQSSGGAGGASGGDSGSGGGSDGRGRRVWRQRGGCRFFGLSRWRQQPRP